jgi:hypothetical protein
VVAVVSKLQEQQEPLEQSLLQQALSPELWALRRRQRPQLARQQPRRDDHVSAA